MPANNWTAWSPQQIGQVSPTYGSSSSYVDLFNRILGNTGPSGVWDYGKTQNTLDQYGTDFSQQFENAVGRPPTADEINQFYTQAVNPVGNTSAGFSGTDPNQVASQYIPQAFQKQIQQQQQSQLPNLEQQISDLGSNVASKTAAEMADPKNPIYQSFSGMMNNLGITPSSGAFQSGMGSTIANSATSTIQSLLGSLGGKAISGNQSPSLSDLSGIGMNAQDQMYQRNNNISDFNLQAQLAKQLAEMGQPSTAQSIMGMASGGAQGAGGIGQGISATNSYICREMVKRGLLCDSDFEDFYLHLFPAIVYKGRAFWHYYLHGQKLVNIANERWPEWAEKMKPVLFDAVMSEKDPVKAVHIYSEGLRLLCATVGEPLLWDERVMRTTLFDSCLFLPRLLFCKAYRQNFWKLMRIKMLIICDNPVCGLHR